MADTDTAGEDGRNEPDLSKPLLSPPKGDVEDPSTEKAGSSWAFLYTSCFVISITTALVMIIGPFLPEEIESWGASKTMNGVVFSVYPFSMLVFSPLAAYFGKGELSSRKRVVIFGMACEAVSAILSGSVEDIIPSDNGSMRIVLFSLFRAAQGLGGSMSWTGMTAITADQFPTKLGFAMGLQETFAGVGFMIELIPAGPAIGGVLYAYGGFILPFAVTGGLLLGAIPILYIISSRLEKSLNELAEAQGTDSLGQDPPKIKDAESSWSLLWKAKGILFTLMTVNFVTFCSMAGLGVLNPTLERHLQSYLNGITKGNIGIVFALAAVTYGSLAPLSGYMSDKLGSIAVMFCGGLISTASFLIVGPSPLIGFLHSIKDPTSRWLIEVTGLLALGAGAALSIIPVMPFAKKTLEKAVSPSIASDISSALFTGVISLGDACGPLIGGALEATIGFEYGMTIMAGITFVSTLLLLPFICGLGSKSPN